MKTLAPVVALFVLILSVPVAAEESSRQDFDDFCKAWQGRWKCDRVLVADEPGFGKKGDKFTSYADCKIAHDGNAMICTIYGGNGTGTWIVAYDAGDKLIRSMFVSSGGVVSRSKISKQGEMWKEVATGSQPDGTKRETSFTVTITNNGKTHTWKGAPVVGGEKSAEVVNVWHRVNK